MILFTVSLRRPQDELYFGLRDYGTAQWDGGDPACDHVAKNARNDVTQERLAERAAQYGTGQGAGSHVTTMQYARVCGKCGATRIDNQIGLEPTLADYLATMVDVFREVRRVLRPDGTCFLNIGDSYAGGGGYYPDAPSNQNGSMQAKGNGSGQRNIKGQRSLHGLKPKDLMMVPARLAIALCDDGWYLRSDIIWHKRAPMPESVTDRPTSAHEHIFLLTKQPRYFYDADAVREESEGTWNAGGYRNGHGRYLNGNSFHNSGEIVDDRRTKVSEPQANRNQRNVWTLSPEPFPAAHFATFPTEIPRRAIKAGTSEKGCCAACGAPWVRQREPTPEYAEVLAKANDRGDWYPRVTTTDKRDDGTKHGKLEGNIRPDYITTGWQPSCACDADVVSCVVLDPFFGAGTTGLVADELGRDCIGIELNPEYATMAENRIRGAAPMFAEVDVA